MREQGQCLNCGYVIDREETVTIRPVEPYPYGRESTVVLKYYADGVEVVFCPGCKGLLPSGDERSDRMLQKTVEVLNGTVFAEDQPFATVKAFMKKYPIPPMLIGPTSVEGSLASVPLQIEGPEVESGD